MRQSVEAALHRIPEVFRTALVLREIEGFAYEEIAEILQANVGTVKSRLMRGRAALREELRPDQDSSKIHGRSNARPHPAPKAGISTEEGLVGR
jgi:RNA polymerase sigma-70 factor (ECF subfamily)